MNKNNLLVIIGPTAVGKTALSIEMAKLYQGEIISADSSQVYRLMNIGTAKVKRDEMENIPHHLVDEFDPDYRFTVQEFQQRAGQLIKEIQGRGRLPIIVGGTGLYIESVTHGYSIPHVPINHKLREELFGLSKIKLYQQLETVDPVSAAKLHPNDRNRIIRALEVFDNLGEAISLVAEKKEALYNSLWVGLTMPRDQLYERINTRVDIMIQSGLIEEVISLKEEGYHRDLTSMQAIGYKEVMSYLEGTISLDTAIDLIKQGSRRYAKRQLSWFRRIEEINWFDVTQESKLSEIQQLIEGKFFL